MKSSGILQLARQRLVDTGWRQGSMGLPEGPNCAMGAVYFSDQTAEQSLPLRSKAYNYMIDTIPMTDYGDIIAKWNDAPERTLEEVLQMFDEAISMAMSDED